MAAEVLNWIRRDLGYTSENGHAALSLKDVEHLVAGKEHLWKALVDASPRLHSVLAFRANEIRADTTATDSDVKEKAMLVRKISAHESNCKSINMEILEIQEEIMAARRQQTERKDVSDQKRIQLMTLKCYKSKIEDNISIMKEYIQCLNSAIEIQKMSRGENENISDLNINITIKRLAAFREAVVLNCDATSESREGSHNMFLHPINLMELKELNISKPKLLTSIASMSKQSLAMISDPQAFGLDMKQSYCNLEDSPPSLAKLVHAEHIASLHTFQDAESLRRQSAAAQAEVERRIHELDKIHERVCPDDGERRLRSLVWQQERDLAAARAAVAAGHATADSLRAALAAQREPWIALRDEYAQLRERIAERDLAQAQFAVLLARNAATKRRLRCKSALLADSVSGCGMDTPCIITPASDKMRKVLMAERRLLRLPDAAGFLGHLIHKCRASGPLSCRAISIEPFLCEVANALDIPGSLARDGLVAACAAVSSRWEQAAAQEEWAREQLAVAEADPRRAAWCGAEAVAAALSAVEKLDQVFLWVSSRCHFCKFRSDPSSCSFLPAGVAPCTAGTAGAVAG